MRKKITESWTKCKESFHQRLITKPKPFFLTLFPFSLILSKNFCPMLVKRTSSLILLAAALVWCEFILLPPIVATLEAPSTEIPRLCYQFFSRICHQDDSRSVHIFGHQLAVCARCSSIYFGFFGGVLFATLLSLRETKRFSIWFRAILLPILIDVLLDSIGIHSSNFFTRITTGLIFGVGSGIFLTPIWVEALDLFLFHTSRHVNFDKVHPNAKA